MSDNHLSPLAARPSATGATRISALDGVRTVAVLIIMGFHFGVGWLPGGFFGVDIFYVLSGYLITGILTGEYRRHGRIKLSAFWLRRASISAQVTGNYGVVDNSGGSAAIGGTCVQSGSITLTSPATMDFWATVYSGPVGGAAVTKWSMTETKVPSITFSS